MAYETFDGVRANFDWPEKEVGADLRAAIARVGNQYSGATSQQISDHLAREGITADVASVNWVLGR